MEPASFCRFCKCSQKQRRRANSSTVLPAPHTSGSLCCLTEYRDRFQAHGNQSKRKSKRTSAEYLPLEGDMSAETTFQADYVAHPTRRRSPKVVKEYVPPEGAMLLKTTYMNDFSIYPVHLKITETDKSHQATTEKMDLLSTYNDEYRAWTPQPQKPFKKTDNLKVTQGTHDLTTTSQVDYGPRAEPPCPRRSFKPEQKLEESLPFEGKSLYSKFFVPHPVQWKSAKPKTIYKPSSAPFLGVTTHRHDFRGDRSSVAKSCKVNATWEPRSSPFKGMSECQDRYRLWPLKPAKSIRKTVEYAPPEGVMELMSVAHTDFRGVPGHPAASARPGIQAWSPGKPFQARSTTQDHFKAWEGAEKSKSFKPNLTRKSPGTFEGTTTFRAEFTPKKGENMRSFKPVERLPSPKSMECDTTYCRTFRQHGIINPCSECCCHQPKEKVVSLGKNGYIVCQAILPEDAKAISRPSTARLHKPSPHPPKARRVQSAGLCRKNSERGL